MKDWREFSIRGEFEARELAWAEAAREEAYKAGQEMSGAAVPWMARYFPDLTHGGAEYHRRKRDARESATLAALAAQQAQALWEAILVTLGDVDQRTDDLAARLNRELAEAEDTLARLQSRAERLSDGTRIYPDREGNWRTEDGRVVDLEEAGLFEEGQPGMPGIPPVSWDEYVAARDRAEALHDAQRQVEDIRARSGEVRHNAQEARERGDVAALERERERADRLREEIEGIERNMSKAPSETVNGLAQNTLAPASSLNGFRPLEI